MGPILPFINVNTSHDVAASDQVHILMSVQRVETPLNLESSIFCFFHRGSTISIVREAWARATRLKVLPMVCTVCMTRGTSKGGSTYLYNVPLQLCNGTMIRVLAMGIRNFTEDLDVNHHKSAGCLFPEVKKDELI